MVTEYKKIVNGDTRCNLCINSDQLAPSVSIRGC